MNQRNRVGTALVVAAAVLLLLPALFPVPPVYVHDARASTSMNETQLRAENVTVVDYQNLSDRGQELYVRTLNERGQYRVPKDEGAPEFDYTTAEDIERLRDDEDGAVLTGVVIDRAGAADLPPAQERFRPGEVEERRIQNNQTYLEQKRQLTKRYDWMITREGQPRLGKTSQLLRLGSVLLAVILLGLGGYFLASKD